jgi:hypothetical protein
VSTASGPAVERVLRVMSFGIGIAALIFAAIKTPDIVGQLPLFGIPWAIATIGLFLAPVAALLPLSFAAPLRTLQVLAVTSGAGFVLSAVAAVAVLPDGVKLEGATGPWPLTISALATSVVAIWMPRGLSFSYLVGSVVITEGVGFVISPGSDLRITLLDSCYTLLFNLVFLGLALTLRSVAARVDQTTQAAIADTRAVAAADARARERGRIGALVHDRVLVTLLTASDPDPARRDDATALAVSGLRALRAPHPPPEQTVSARDLIWRVQSVATELCPQAAFTHTDLAAAVIPAEVGDAIVEAVAEALRNSIRHADRDHPDSVSRAVHVEADALGVEATVIDDGSGFDLGKVPADRLGIAVSIDRRMAAVPGGQAFVVSRPEIGTRVTVRWTHDD